MVSGFFTSPCDHSRIFSGDARLMRIAENESGSFGFSKKLKMSFTKSLLFSSLRNASGIDRRQAPRCLRAVLAVARGGQVLDGRVVFAVALVLRVLRVERILPRLAVHVAIVLHCRRGREAAARVVARVVAKLVARRSPAAPDQQQREHCERLRHHAPIFAATSRAICCTVVTGSCCCRGAFGSSISST